MSDFENFAYIVASILFILGIKMLGKASTARRGNAISAVGMLLAIVVTMMAKGLDLVWIVIGLLIGTAIGVIIAQRVKMTQMPEMVALLNGFGGLASLFVGWVEWERIRESGWTLYFARAQEAWGEAAPSWGYLLTVIGLTVIIGGITFTGSVEAWGKLSGKLGGGKARTFAGQKALNIGLFCVALLATIGLAVAGPDTDLTLAYILFLLIVIASLILGVTGVLPIGGGDMPVVISLLNSLSGLAAAAAGFVIFNNVLIVAGCLVGTSGVILTLIMCKAMNRNLLNVLFSGFGSGSATAQAVTGEMKAATPADAFFVLEAARSVAIIPGYGMAVAQAQHAVKELGELLEENGAEVHYIIHPVAGRMPGHMNVLLAEADVAYEKLKEMDAMNPLMGNMDVAIVIGANDVVNPAAANDPGSPIYGMPIIKAHEAKSIFALKRGKGTGFSGLENALYFHEKTRMLYGDAKGTVSALVNEFKDSKKNA